MIQAENKENLRGRNEEQWKEGIWREYSGDLEDHNLERKK
jgi:hypothetical protein